MAEILSQPVPHPARGTTTAEGFLADRQAFWASVVKFTTYVLVFLVALLLFLWWWLV